MSSLDDIIGLIENCLQSNDNYVNLIETTIAEIKENKKKFGQEVIGYLDSIICDEGENEFRRFQALRLFRDCCLLIKGGFIGKVMKCRGYKYAVKTCAFEPGNNDPNKGRKIFGAVQDDFYSLEFFKMSLRLVYELSDKYGTDKKKRKTKFQDNIDKLVQKKVNFGVLLDGDEVIMNLSSKVPGYPKKSGDKKGQGATPVEQGGILEMMMTLDSVKSYLKDTLKNDKGPNMSETTSDVVGQVKYHFDNANLTEERVMELFSLGIGEQEASLKFEEYQNLMKFKKVLNEKYPLFQSGVMDYRKFRKEILSNIATQESIEQMERDGVTPMADNKSDKNKGKKQDEEEDNFGNLLDQNDIRGFNPEKQQDFNKMLDEEGDDFNNGYNGFKGGLDEDSEDDIKDFLGGINKIEKKQPNNFLDDNNPEDFNINDIDEGVGDDNRKEFGFGDIDKNQKDYLENQRKQKEYEEEMERRRQQEEMQRKEQQKRREGEERRRKEEEERRREEQERRREEEERRREQERRRDEQERRKREEEEMEHQRQIELIKQKEREVLEQKEKEKRREEEKQRVRKLEREKEKERRKKEEEELYGGEGEGEEEEEEAQVLESPQQSYQRYLDGLNPSESKFKTLKRKGSLVKNAKSNMGSSPQINGGVPDRKEFSESKHGAEMEFEPDDDQPLELYRHPLKVPGVSKIRSSVKKDYSERELTELENLKRENIQLKKVNSTLKSSQDSKTIEKLYMDNQKLRSTNADLVLKLKETQRKLDSMVDGLDNPDAFKRLEREHKKKLEKMEKKNLKDNATIMKLENKIYEKDDIIRKRDKVIQDMLDQNGNSSFNPEFGNLMMKKAEKKKDNEMVKNLKNTVNSLGDKLTQKDREILDLEETLQKQKQIRIGLEKENNFLRVRNIQNKRDELEVERLKAEIERLRNLASEYKEQAEFYGKTNKERERQLLADKNLKRVNLNLRGAPVNARMDSDYNKLTKKLNDSIRTKSNINFSGKLKEDNQISNILSGYLQNYNDKDLKIVKIRGKGDLYEDQNLRIEIKGKPVKIKSDKKLFYKITMFFINKDDFLAIKNLSPAFTGNRDMKFMTKPNINSVKVLDLPPNSNFKLEILITPTKLPITPISLNFHYFMDGDTQIITKKIRLPLGIHNFINPKSLSNMNKIKEYNFSETVSSRLFQPDPSILRAPNDILKLYPEMEKLATTVNTRKSEFGGLYECLVQGRLFLLRFIWDKDTELVKFQANCQPADSPVIQKLVDSLMDLVDLQ